MGNAPSTRAPAPCRHATSRAVCAPAGAPKSVWGPLYWKHLHLRAIAWRDTKDVRAIVAEHNYLRTFFSTLPCPECCVHAVLYYERNMPNLALGESYQLWMFTFHNAVNQRLGKPTISYQEYQALYQSAILGRP